MAVFYVNGSKVEAAGNTRLLLFLREELKLTSVKDGCTEGACGACTVLVNGKPSKACNWTVSELEGMSVQTVEGLTEREKEIFTYSFGEAGAVQCGFCIPGMVMCAKGLLDENPNPTEKEIRHTIRNNICRCTGYVKIVKAIQLAAQIFRDIPEDDYTEKLQEIRDRRIWKVGARVHRVDVQDKVTGNGVYADDIFVPGMLHVAAVRSKYPRARVLSIDVSAAAAVPGVAGVFTAANIPGDLKVGHIVRDWDAMIPAGGITRYVGDVIALAAAENQKTLEKALKLVKVDYEVLKPVTSPYEAMKPDAPPVHEEKCLSADGNTGGNTGNKTGKSCRKDNKNDKTSKYENVNLLGHTHVSRGNVEEVLKTCDFVLTEKFSTPRTEHAFLEPEAAVAFPLEDGSVKIFSSDQGVYDTRRETAPMLGLPEEKVLVENCYVGGAFGGKEDVSVQHYAALAAVLTGRPCKMKLTRQESLIFHPKRHPMDMEFTLGCSRDGIIRAVKATVIADTGAYASLGLPVLQRACTHASGPYNYQNFEIDGYAYYTNNPPSGAFRGFGVTQTCFGIETMLNLMADKIGISHWEIRYRNAIRPGQELPNGQIVDNSTGLAETLEAVKDYYYSSPYAGIACAMKNAGVGVGLPDYGRVRLEVRKGKVIIHCGGSCLGQGLCTVLKQVVCDVTGLGKNLVVEEKANTFNAPDSGTSSGSRHTTISGEAARRAAVMLKEAISASGDTLVAALKALEGREFYAEYLAATDPFGSDLPNPKSHVAYGYATQVCILDEKTHKVDKLIAAHDVGRAVNPTNIEGQIEGGAVMGLGYALRENYEVKDCVPQVKFGSLKLFRADEVPEIIPIIVEKAGLDVSSGAIGIGEITCIPTAPAVADAYYRLDGELRRSLPLANTPYADAGIEKSARSVRSLAVNKNVRCIGCLECVRACARTFKRPERADMGYLKVVEKAGVGNFSGIRGSIIRPSVCIQCGKCAKVCPVNAICQNRFGVWVVDTKICINCGKCRETCPFGVILETPFASTVDLVPRTRTGQNSTLEKDPAAAGHSHTDMVSTKCIACGACVRACPMGVLSLTV